MKLLGDTFKLDLKKETKNKKEKKKSDSKKTEIPFLPQRFPSQFKVNSKTKGDTEVANIPLNGEKTIRFSTDCANDYFDRTDEPGELKIAILFQSMHVKKLDKIVRITAYVILLHMILHVVSCTSTQRHLTSGRAMV